jgi:hypothetical protein
MLLRFPVAFQLPAFASWAILCPLRISAFLAVGPPVMILRPDLNGVAMFHTSEIRPGRVPPIPRDWRCSLTGVGSTGQRLPHSSGQSSPRYHIPSAGLIITRHQRRFTRFTLSVFSFTCDPRMEREPLGLTT